MENYSGSRSDRILEAKQAFRDDGVKKEYSEGQGHSLVIFRFLAAGFLFLVCFICLQADGTVFGIEKESIIQAVSDEKYWDGLLRKVGEIAGNFIK